jgi:hypothetical protein
MRFGCDFTDDRPFQRVGRAEFWRGVACNAHEMGRPEIPGRCKQRPSKVVRVGAPVVNVRTTGNL